MFKICSTCQSSWDNRDSFIDDRNLKFLGYQACLEDLDKGLFLFNHNCGSTIAVTINLFYDLYSGPIWQEPLMNSEICPGYCLIEKEHRTCPNKCNCAHIRKVMHLLVEKMGTS